MFLGGNMMLGEEYLARDIERRANDSFGELQGLSFTGQAVLSFEGRPKEERKIRYRIGYRENDNVLPPMSLESLIPNPGEPHMSDVELADKWTAFNGETLGTFDRGFIQSKNGAAPKRRFSVINLQPGYGVDFFRSMFADYAFHIGPTGLENSQMVGTLSSIAPGSTVKLVGEYQGLPLVELTRATIHEGKTYSVTTKIVVGPTLFILGVSSFEGLDEIILSRLLGREVLKLDVREGFLVPIHYRWSQLKPQKIEYELHIDSVERLPVDFKGLWLFDQPTGTRIADHVNVETRRIKFTDEEEEKIREFMGLKSVQGRSRYPRILFYVFNVVLLMAAAWHYRGKMLIK